MRAKCVILLFVSSIVLVRSQELKTNANNTQNIEENVSSEDAIDSKEDTSFEDINEVKVDEANKISHNSGDNDTVTARSSEADRISDIIIAAANSSEDENSSEDFNELEVTEITKIAENSVEDVNFTTGYNGTDEISEFESSLSNKNSEDDIISEDLQEPRAGKSINTNHNSVDINLLAELKSDSEEVATEELTQKLAEDVSSNVTGFLIQGATQNFTQEVSQYSAPDLIRTITENLVRDYRAVYDEYLVVLYKQIAARSNSNFVFSPRAIWLTLAALAEGSNLESQTVIFKFLRLPNDIAIRKKYYMLAVDRISPGDDVYVSSKNTLVIDDGLSINIKWFNFISENYLLDVVSAPIKRYPHIAAEEMRRVVSSPLRNLKLTGNSVLLNAVDYDGLWRNAFSDATIERSPFYNQQGEKIGSVDLMKIKRRVRLNYIERFKGKILELPVGVDNRYRMIFAINTEPVNITEIIQKLSRNIVNEMVDNLKETDEAIEVAIPRIRISSEIDMRALLQDDNITSIWSDPTSTRSITEPALLPSGYYQRATMTLNSGGLEPDYLDPSVKTSNESFIANKPFLFSLFDAETYTCIIAIGYTQPTYKD